MAKIEMGILGGFSGRVGTVVGYYRRGGWYVRAYQPNIKDRRSEAQLAQRSRFKAMIQFASQATVVLRVGFRGEARRAGLTEGNVFLRENHVRFSSRTSGTSLTSFTRNSGIDFAGLRFSMGSLPGVRLEEATVDEGGALQVRWESLGGVRGDRVHLYVYSENCRQGLAAQGERGKGRSKILLPAEFAGSALHVWAFAEGKEGRVSGTAYASVAEQVGNDLVGGNAFGFSKVVADEAVAQHVVGHSADVLGVGRVLAVEGGIGACADDKVLRGARAGTP